MPNPNATVSAVIRLDPPLDRAPAEILRSGRDITVDLEGGRRVRLDPANPRSAGFAQVLDGLSKQKRLVYLEVDPASSSITRVLIPHVARVVGVRAGEDGLDVDLERSQARHVLRRGALDFDEMERLLHESLDDAGGVVVLTEDDAHQIIDVRQFRPGPELPPRR